MKTLVIDNGSFEIKAGFSNNELPTHYVYNHYIKLPNMSLMHGITKKLDIFPPKCYNFYNLGNVQKAKKKGVITDFGNMKVIWDNLIFS